MKKLSLVLSALLLVSAVTGCTNTNVKKDGASDKITIKWMGPPYYSETQAASFSEKLLEEKFGVEIDAVYLDEEAYKMKKPLMMSSGDIPDLIYEMDPIHVQADVKQGFLAEIPYDTIKQFAPKIMAEINKSAPNVWLYPYFEGKNYGLVNLFYGGDEAMTSLWRKDWLDNVGITKIPETIDEMHEAFVKFVNEDPNKSGKKDTFALTGDMGRHYSTFSEIFGAYGTLPFNWMEVDNKIIYGGLTEGTQDALKTLAAWYREGLIDPDFITDDHVKNTKTKFQNGSIGYMNHFGREISEFDADYPDSMLNILKQLNSKGEIVEGTLPKGPEGKSGTFVWGKGGHIITFGKQVGDQPEKMEVLLKMFDYMFENQDFLTKLQIGEEGIHYEKDAEKGGIKFKAPFDKINERKLVLASENLASPAFFGVMPVLQETRELALSNAQKEYAKKGAELNGMQDAFMKPDVVPESEKYFQNLKNKQIILMTEIIRGEKPADSYITEFTSIWNQLGGEVLTKNAEELYVILGDIKKHVGADD